MKVFNYKFPEIFVKEKGLLLFEYKDWDFETLYNSNIKKASYVSKEKNSLSFLSTQEFIKEKAFLLKFSFSEIKQVIEIARDLDMWNEKSIVELFPTHDQKK